MNFLQRLRDVLGIDDVYEYADEYAEEGEFPLPEEADPAQSEETARSRPNNVIGMPRGMPRTGQIELVMMQPRLFQEIPQAVEALRQRKSVVLDLTLMDTDQAQRSADYVAGGAYAIDGHQRHLGSCIFLFTPSFVQISSYPAAESPVAHEPSAPPPATYVPPVQSVPPSHF